MCAEHTPEKHEERRNELFRAFCRRKEDTEKVSRLIDELIFIEGQMAYLRTLPFIMVCASNPCKQKATHAARQYKDMSNQYVNILKLLLRLSGDLGEGEEESPLRKWAREKVNDR